MARGSENGGFGMMLLFKTTFNTLDGRQRHLAIARVMVLPVATTS